MKRILYKYYFNFINHFYMLINRRLKIQPDVELRKTKIRANGSVFIGSGCRIGRYCQISPDGGNIYIDENTSINSFSVLSGLGGITIGKYVAIAPRCSIIASNHVFNDSTLPIKKQGLSSKGIVIEDDVWLGIGAIILDGVTIGKGSIVGAGSVVTKNVDPNTIVAGVPARVIKRRNI